VMEQAGRRKENECQDQRDHHVVMNAAARVSPPNVAADCATDFHFFQSMGGRRAFANGAKLGAPRFRTIPNNIFQEKRCCALRLSFATLWQKAERQMAITRRQREVYDFIAQFVQKRGYSPSFEEIGKGLDLSSLATVHKHITNLERKG